MAGDRKLKKTFMARKLAFNQALETQTDCVRARAHTPLSVLGCFQLRKHLHTLYKSLIPRPSDDFPHSPFKHTMSKSSAPEDDNKMPELEEATPLNNTVSPSAEAAALMQNLILSPGGSPQPVAPSIPSQQGDDMATPGSSSILAADNSTPLTPIPAAPFSMGLPVVPGPNALPTETPLQEILAQLLAENSTPDNHAPRVAATLSDAMPFVDSLERVDISTIPAEDMKCPHCWLPFGTTADDDPSFVWAPHLEATPELAERNAALRELPFSRANNDPVRTPCGHIFGRDCLIRSMEDVNTLCPTCRQEMLPDPAAASDDETDTDSDGVDEDEEEEDDDDFNVGEGFYEDDGNSIDWEFESEVIDEIIYSQGQGASEEIGPHESHEEGTGETDEDDAGDGKDSMADESAGTDKAGKDTGV